MYEMPGVSESRETFENEFLWGGGEHEIPKLEKQAVIDGSARDSANSLTHHLRPGLLLGKVTATNKLKEFDPDAVDGTETLYGVLPVELVLKDVEGNDQDAVCPVIVTAPVKIKNLLLKGAAVVGNADEQAVRDGLNAKRFYIDDEF